jgi:hypothetical protein
MEAVDASEPDFYGADISAPATPGNIEGSLPAAANAAVALAQLHHQLGPDWDSDAVRFPELQRLNLQSQLADKETGRSFGTGDEAGDNAFFRRTPFATRPIPTRRIVFVSIIPTTRTASVNLEPFSTWPI